MLKVQSTVAVDALKCALLVVYTIGYSETDRVLPPSVSRFLVDSSTHSAFRGFLSIHIVFLKVFGELQWGGLNNMLLVGSIMILKIMVI